MDIGVQLFGCSRVFRQNPQAFFLRMKAAGINQIEPCILFDDPQAFRQRALESGNSFAAALPDLLWSPREAVDFAQELAGLGMTMSSAHAFVSDTEKSRDLMVNTARDSGLRALVMGVSEEGRKEPQAYADRLSCLAAPLGKVGTELWLHNGQGDAAAPAPGQPSPYERVLSGCPELYAQPDTGWLMFDGQEPCVFLRGLGSRLHSVHFKDLDKDYKQKAGQDIFAVLGSGCVDNRGAWGFVGPEVSAVIDQDMSKGDFLADLGESAAFLKSL